MLLSLLRLLILAVSFGCCIGLLAKVLPFAVRKPNAKYRAIRPTPAVPKLSRLSAVTTAELQNFLTSDGLQVTELIE